MDPKFYPRAGKLAKGLETYVNIYRLPISFQLMANQKRELEGDFPFDQNLYFNNSLENMVRKQKENRRLFM